MSNWIRFIFIAILLIFSCSSCQKEESIRSEQEVEPQFQKTYNSIETVEVEDCYINRTTGCYTSGEWKVWDLPEFSNGRLINNENPRHMGQASDSSSFYLNFEGTGVIIVYRQDTWYGVLTVEIDRRKIGSINQEGGRIRNQAEKYFDAGSMGGHSLVLSGSKATGVITIDAIKILGDQVSK